MSLSTTQKNFIDSFLPYAEQAQEATGVPAPVILAQWINETGAGTSSLFKSGYNFAGIKDFSAGGFKKYGSYQEGVAGYIRVLNLPYYEKVRTAGTIKGAAEALVASPWEETGYQQGKLIYPLIEDVTTYLKTQTGSSILNRLKSLDGGLSQSLPSQSTAAIESAGGLTEEASAVGEGLLVFSVISIAALIGVVLIFRAIGGSDTVKAVLKNGK